MYTIGQVAQRFALSRSTLLYYDSLGLLTPSGRNDANYRLYSENDLKRMEKIALYREAGLSLEHIASLLDNEQDELAERLEQRLCAINAEIQSLREQQQLLLSIMDHRDALPDSRVMTKERWVAILEAAGLDETAMHRWHTEFERMAPEGHQDFLESLGIDEAEIRAIRHGSRP